MAKSITLLFPGQGSQVVGMGNRFASNTHYSLFKKASAKLNFDLHKMITSGSEDELKMTFNAQPAILSYSIILYQILLDTIASQNVTIDCVLGHSLGEYSALCAAGTLSFENAVWAVHMRGKFMQEAVPANTGSMVAIMKASETIVRQACIEASQNDSQVMPANFNEPNQIVISGHLEACLRASKLIADKTEGKARSIPLKVSAPFHSSYMKPAAIKLQEFFSDYHFKSNSIPYIANINACEYKVGTDVQTIKNNLIQQMTGSVLWTQSISKLPENTICLEVGPGKVLTGLVSKINPKVKVIPLDTDGGFNELKEIIS